MIDYCPNIRGEAETLLKRGIVRRFIFD